MKKCFKLLIAISLALFTQMAVAQTDPGIPDSMLITGGPLVIGKSVPLNFIIKNDETLMGYALLLKMLTLDGGFARLDSSVYVNRMADPSVAMIRFYTTYVNGVSPDSVAQHGFGGEQIPVGESPILQLFFTGLSEGRMVLRSFIGFTGSQSCIFVGVTGGSFVTINKEIPPYTVNIVDQPAPPYVSTPYTTFRAIAGSDIRFSFTHGSTEGLATAAEILSTHRMDNEFQYPSTFPSIIDGEVPEFNWSTSSDDIGIWQTVLRVFDTDNLETFLPLEVQLVTSSDYLVDFGSVSSEAGMDATSFVAGNFDNDASPEVFVTGGYSLPFTGAALYEVDGGGLTRVAIFDSDLHKFGAHSGYFDADENLDIILSSYAGSYLTYWMVQCYLGNGHGAFDTRSVPFDKAATRGSALGEFTGDSWLDYVLTNGTSLYIFESNGDGTFDAAIELTTSDSLLTLNAADFDADGRDDLAVGSRHGIRIYRQTTPGAFTPGVLYPQIYGSADIEVTNSGSDFNGDGIFDLCVATPSVGGAQSQMMVYFGHTDGTFTQEEIRTLNGQILANCVGDFNNDTKLDIAFCNGSMRYVGIVFGDGTGGFENELRFAIPTLRPHHLECLDYDLDGDLDLVVAASGNVSEHALFLLTNQNDPAGFSSGSLTVLAEDNAQITIMAPNGSQLSEVCNTIPASSIYKRDLNGNEILDSYANLTVVEDGEYVVKVMPKPNLPSDAQFCLEYVLDGQKYRIARGCSAGSEGGEFGLAVEQSGVYPRPGSFVKSDVDSLVWEGSGQFDIRIALDPNFEEVILEGSTVGNKLYLPDLEVNDTTAYFWQVKPSGTATYKTIYAFNIVDAATPVADQNEPILPNSYVLEQNYPNPFNPTTKIGFSLPRPQRATVRITNTLGETVAVLIDKIMPAGTHVVEWRGVDKFGHPVPSGVYFCSLKAGEYSAVRKMILMK